MRRVPLSWAVFVLVLGGAAPSQAEPQANVGVTAGPVGVSSGRSWWTQTRLHLGVHGDVLFGRRRNADAAIGPFGEVLTSFEDVQLGTGVSGLLPVHPYLPLVVSGGGYGRHSSRWGWEPGVSAQVLWGSRSYNHRSAYVLAGGVRVEFRQGLGESKERSVVVAAHLDGEVLLLPLMLAYEWLRGPPR